MTTNFIARVNNVDIVSTNDEQKLVPIKPICEALGIAWEPQIKKVQEHYLLSSTAMLSTIVADNEKECEMLCIPLMYVVGWIFSDDIRLAAVPDRVMELHNALWKYLDKEKNVLAEKLQIQDQMIESLRREIVELEQYYEDELTLEEEVE